MNDTNETLTVLAELIRIRHLLERHLLEPDVTKSNVQPASWMTTAEAAAYLRMEASGLRTLIKRGRITPDGRGARRMHMFRRETLDAYLARGVPCGAEDRASPVSSATSEARLPGSVTTGARSPARTMRSLVRGVDEPRVGITTELRSSARNATGRGSKP